MNALFILDAKGKVILSRQYRGYVTNAVVSRFVAQLLEEEEVNLKVSRIEIEIEIEIGAESCVGAACDGR